MIGTRTNDIYTILHQRILLFLLVQWMPCHQRNVIINHWLLINVIRSTLFNSTKISLRRWWLKAGRPTSINIHRSTDLRNTAISYFLYIPFNMLGYNVFFDCTHFYFGPRSLFLLFFLFLSRARIFLSHFLHFHRTDWCTKNGLQKFVLFGKVLSRRRKPM